VESVFLGEDHSHLFLLTKREAASRFLFLTEFHQSLTSYTREK